MVRLLGLGQEKKCSCCLSSIGSVYGEQRMYIHGKRVELGGPIIYRESFDGTQPARDGPYRGYVCNIEQLAVQVRADGWWGNAPLLTVLVFDILTVEH